MPKNALKSKKLKVHKCLTCSEGDSIAKISKVLKENKDRRIFVVDNDNGLKGIITTTDLVYKALANDKLNLKAADIMEKNVGVIDLKEPLEKALGIMNAHKSFVCPVVEKKKLLGVVSYHDILDYVVSDSREG